MAVAAFSKFFMGLSPPIIITIIPEKTGTGKEFQSRDEEGPWN
jgi:hypothetical protein